MHERVCGESAHALVRSVARVAEVVEVVLERRVRSVGVDARHIREEVVDRDRPGERCEHHPPVLDAVEDLHVGELGDVARDRVVESQLAGFDQHQRADAGDRLRGDAEDRVRLHRQAGFDVALADAGELGHLVMSRDEHDGPGDLASLNASSDVRAGALKPWARQAHVLSGVIMHCSSIALLKPRELAPGATCSRGQGPASTTSVHRPPSPDRRARLLAFAWAGKCGPRDPMLSR